MSKNAALPGTRLLSLDFYRGLTMFLLIAEFTHLFSWFTAPELKGVLFFAVVGMNPLFIYLFAHVGGADLMKQIIHPFSGALFVWTGELPLHMITSLFTLAALWGICYWMYRRRIFIKI